MEVKVISFAPAEIPLAARRVNNWFRRDFPETWDRIVETYARIEQEEDLFEKDREVLLLDPAESDNYVILSAEKFYSALRHMNELAQVMGKTCPEDPQ